MGRYYKDYVWKNGIPYGIGVVEENALYAFKIPSDPYHKRMAIERFKEGNFEATLYDSALFDFRHLKPVEQTAWRKIIISENDEEAIAQIFNQDDRLIVIEKYAFEKGLCRQCIAYSPHGILLSRQQMYYSDLEDSSNGVILYDSFQKPVMFKRYLCDPISGEFSNLIEEVWDGSQISAVLPQFLGGLGTAKDS